MAAMECTKLGHAALGSTPQARLHLDSQREHSGPKHDMQHVARTILATARRAAVYGSKG